MKNNLFYLAMLLISTCFVSAQEIRVEPNTCLKLEAWSSLDITMGNLIIESSSSGDTSLIDFGNVSCEAKVQRWITESEYHLISSPITNAVSGMFLADYLSNASSPN